MKHDPRGARRPEREELTWSLMHPTEIDLDYMREVVAAAETHDVDSFEICGVCHGPRQGLNGCIGFRHYPEIMARRDLAQVQADRDTLRRAVDLAHGIGRPVLYWHREVVVPPGAVETIPGLLDERGEFDLLGQAYATLMRNKIAEFFEAVPAMDGVVLTLTEADYSVIHNSNADRYPPRDVVERIVSIFAEELAARGKRFVLRSFGSIPQDYEDILAGAERVAARHSFEIESKITPYDFSPFLPYNPWLKPARGTTISAEYDTVGEFLGAGHLPAANVERILRDVAHARACGVARHAVRVDRWGNSMVRSVYGVNALAFTRAVRNPSITADEVWREWADAHWGAAGEEMTGIMKRSIDVVKKTHFIDGHVIFHTNPPSSWMKWIKASGIFSVFQPGVSLENQRFNWGILSERTAPAREKILAEKDEAVSLAADCRARLDSLRGRMPEAEFARACALWDNAVAATRLVREFCRCIGAYFHDMEAGNEQKPGLEAAIVRAREEFLSWLDSRRLEEMEAKEPGAFYDAITQERFKPRSRDIAEVYALPLWLLIQSLRVEYQAEFAARREWQALPGVVDFVVCGGITFEHRVEKAMHASHSAIHHGRPVRIVGNHVFPNGYIEYTLKRPPQGAQLVVRGDAGTAECLRVSADGDERVVALNRGEARIALPPSAEENVRVRLAKEGLQYPWIYGVAVLTQAAHK